MNPTLDAIEKAAEAAKADVPGPWKIQESMSMLEIYNDTDPRLDIGYFSVCEIECDHQPMAEYLVKLDPATVLELVRLARDRDQLAARLDLAETLIYDCVKTARARGDSDLCDAIDNDGNPYTSASLNDFIMMIPNVGRVEDLPQ